MNQTPPQEGEETRCSKSSGCSRASCNWIPLLTISMLVLQLITIAFVYQRTAYTNVRSSLVAFETEKLGGSENYDLSVKLNATQFNENKPRILEYLESQGVSGTSKDTTLPSLSQDQISKILASSFLEGDKNGDVLLVEYSDPECPFCIMQAKSQTVQSVLSQYPNGVAHAFKTHRGVNHKNTATKSRAIICAGVVGGAEKYTQYYRSVLEKSDESSQDGFAGYPLENLAKLANDLKIDAKKFQECRESPDSEKAYIQSTAEGDSLGVRGTPGTMVIHRKTGKYKLVNGAQKPAAFMSAIEAVSTEK